MSEEIFPPIPEEDPNEDNGLIEENGDVTVQQENVVTTKIFLSAVAKYVLFTVSFLVAFLFPMFYSFYLYKGIKRAEIPFVVTSYCGWTLLGLKQAGSMASPSRWISCRLPFLGNIKSPRKIHKVTFWHLFRYDVLVYAVIVAYSAFIAHASWVLIQDYPDRTAKNQSYMGTNNVEFFKTTSGGFTYLKTAAFYLIIAGIMCFFKKSREMLFWFLYSTGFIVLPGRVMNTILSNLCTGLFSEYYSSASILSKSVCDTFAFGFIYVIALQLYGKDSPLLFYKRMDFFYKTDKKKESIKENLKDLAKIVFTVTLVIGFPLTVGYLFQSEKSVIQLGWGANFTGIDYELSENITYGRTKTVLERFHSQPDVRVGLFVIFELWLFFGTLHKMNPIFEFCRKDYPTQKMISRELGCFTRFAFLMLVRFCWMMRFLVLFSIYIWVSLFIGRFILFWIPIPRFLEIDPKDDLVTFGLACILVQLFTAKLRNIFTQVILHVVPIIAAFSVYLLAGLRGDGTTMKFVFLDIAAACCYYIAYKKANKVSVDVEAVLKPAVKFFFAVCVITLPAIAIEYILGLEKLIYAYVTPFYGVYALIIFAISAFFLLRVLNLHLQVELAGETPGGQVELQMPEEENQDNENQAENDSQKITLRETVKKWFHKHEELNLVQLTEKLLATMKVAPSNRQEEQA
ncbi:hypothetical protein L596_028752 [Steinernema carpocapsae]|uniref:Uncharacterized protein n=1 Tax=Steinernema carpocapsae TaxID=34508 RepID=A0A4U5LZB0_STECR|nr:hypothetical protein L596_028752 [Steinernema carpocapsae]